MRSDREASISHFNNRIYRHGSIPVGSHKLSPQVIIEKLGPHLTTERRNRIESVVNGRTFSVATVTEHLFDVGNISAVMRSAESYGFLPFHIVERVDAKYKKSDRISKGSEKWLDIHRYNGAEVCLSQLKKEGYQVLATSLEATKVLHDFDFSKKTAIVFGNEKEGISDSVKEHADHLFKLPMYGFAQSFNISVAAAIAFSHIHALRVKSLGDSCDSSPEEKAAVTAAYYLRSFDNPELYF